MGAHAIGLVAKAFLAGFIVAVPLGAIGAMCLRRAFAGRLSDALVTGFGAAVADSMWAAAAVLGLSLFTGYVLEHDGPARIVGGLVLIGVGAKMIHSRRRQLVPPAAELAAPPAHRWRTWCRDAATGFGLTIINPATFIGFIGVCAGLGLFVSDLDTLVSKWFIVLGAFAGSMLWWVILSLTASAIRHRIPFQALAMLNAGLGVLVAGLGVASLLSAFSV
ncbi:MAG: LysE family transporter [Defluviicoccus sp.]